MKSWLPIGLFDSFFQPCTIYLIRMHHILQSYLRRLTNLSSNNRSLYLPRLTAHQYLDVHSLDFANNFSSFKIIEWLIAGGKNDLEDMPDGVIPLCPVVDSRDEDSNLSSQRIKKLVRTEKFLLEEQGSKDLYVGWPFVQGKFSNGTLVRCPLLFFPVNIEEHRSQALGHQWVLTRRDEVPLSLNKSFLLAYAHYNELPYDDTLAERMFDDFDTDSRVFRTSLYQLFKEGTITLNFNQEIFVDALHSFQEFTKADLEAEKAGELKLHPEAVLGIFPQAGSYLVPDYLQLMDNPQVPDIESFFAKRASSEWASEELATMEDALSETAELRSVRQSYRVKEEQIFAPYPLDAYQEAALKQVKKGNSIVVQGPPGTGKSQLIVNLIADYTAQGKRVLLVCQKRAALDVVYARLKKQDVHPFVGLVHDFKNDRKAVYQQISQQIDALYEYQLKNNGLDAIFLERNFLQYSRRIEQICEELDEFKEALFDTQEAGVSVKELYLTSDLHGEAINLKQEYRHFAIPELSTFLNKLRTYTNYATRLDRGDYLLSQRKPFDGYAVQDYQTIRTIVEEVPVLKESVSRRASEILRTEVTFTEAENLQQRSPDIRKFVDLLKEETSYRYFQQMVPLVGKEADPLWLENLERVILECYAGAEPETSLSSGEELGKFQKLLLQAQEARSGVTQWAWWKLFSKEKEYVQSVFEANYLEQDKEGFALLAKRLDTRLNLEHNLTKLREPGWVQEVPTLESSDGFSQAFITEWFHHQKQALEATLLFRSFRNFSEYFSIKTTPYSQLKSQLEQILGVLNEIPAKTKAWERYLLPTQVSQLNTPEESASFNQTLAQDFDALADFDTLKHGLLQYETDIIARLFEQLPEVNEQTVTDLFQNSVRLAWIDHIETKYPVLRIVSSARLTDLERDLQQAIEDKLAISKEILLMKLREKTYYDVEYNRLNNMVTYRDLHHQVSKKRKIWPLRKLVANFEQELFNLIPCWLASPETVSAVFPMNEQPLFDLVIFDEASQCFAEKGIPAMYRGQQVVVVGDHQQLSPHDLYQARWEEDAEPASAEDATALEANSLLDLASHYLSTVRLEGHYRSRSLDLIDFSNQHFYEGRLKLLPDFQDVARHEPSIIYQHVAGEWQQQTNAKESEAVVQLVRKLLDGNAEASIGVITFNAKQQERVADDLEKVAIAEQRTLPETLFVKNIENVQGDERDIIIFSTAYAPNEKGKVMLQFGSLNAVKGENRLNVAITRAKEKIYVITSLWPQQLEVANTKNEGPKLLKQYLQYAQEVSEGRYASKVAPLSSHAAEWFLLHHLQAWSEEQLPDYQSQRLLPFADLTIHKANTTPEQYIGLINTDDDLYYQSISAKEMHAYRPFVYRDKHWKFKHIYSRQRWQQPQQVQESLQRFIINSEGEL